MLGIESKSLAERIADLEFCPEIYIYPTPRMYQPLPDFSLHGLQLTDEINVYVHVPFCKQFCSFCGYFKTIYEENLQADFVDAVVAEIALRAESLYGKVIKTLHFGGGTPSLLSPQQLDTSGKGQKRANPRAPNSALEVSF